MMKRRTESQGTPWPGSRCGAVLGSNDAEEGFVVCPFVGVLVGDVFVVLTGSGVVGAVWGEGTGGRVTRSSGAWTC